MDSDYHPVKVWLEGEVKKREREAKARNVRERSGIKKTGRNLSRKWVG